MKKIILIGWVLFNITACGERTSSTNKEDLADLNKLFDTYYEERLRLYPLEATLNGDNRYNHLLPINIAEGYRDTLHNFYSRYLNAIEKYDTSKLAGDDLNSYKIFEREMRMQLEALDLKLSINFGEINILPF